MTTLLKRLLVLVVKTLARLILGFQVHHWERLPTKGPAILVANHNSHLDALILMALYPLEMATQLRPVANEQYFLQQNRYLAWFSRHVLNIVPIRCQPSRSLAGRRHLTFLKHCTQALNQDQILILFPEGSRGQPEQMGKLHGGIAHLAKRHPHVPIVPIFLTGLGNVLPKGSLLPTPCVCSATIGPSLFWNGCKRNFLQRLTAQIQTFRNNISDERPGKPSIPHG